MALDENSQRPFTANNNNSAAGEAVIEVSQLVRQFGENQALKGVSLTIEKGKVFGIVGENGAGKTTLIKHILGQYKAQQGTVKVFGLNPAQEPAKVLSRIGYLSEEPDLPAWMTIDEFLTYMSAFYPKWDMDFAYKLADRFGLNRSSKIGELSKGQRARVGLTAAQAHYPDLLLLDEPSSGLDPIVRRDIFTAIIETTKGYGGTVLFSSHLLEEVEDYSEHLTMIRKGQLLMSEPMQQVLDNHLLVEFSDAVDKHKLEAMESCLKVSASEGKTQLACYNHQDHLLSLLQQQDITHESIRTMTLDEIFSLRSEITIWPSGAL